MKLDAVAGLFNYMLQSSNQQQLAHENDEIDVEKAVKVDLPEELLVALKQQNLDEEITKALEEHWNAELVPFRSCA